MLLSARMLSHVASANIYTIASQAVFTDGDAPTIYFQLVDVSLDRPQEGFSPAGRRYCPDENAEVQVTLGSIDSAKRITRIAVPAFPKQDMSIWKVQLMPTDKIAGSTDLHLTLTENGRTVRGVVRSAVVAHPQDSSR